MTEAERVNTAWDRIEKWFSRNMPDFELDSGAAATEIQGLETHLNVTLPEGLKTSLHRHNGINEGKWPKFCLLSLEHIKQDWGVRTSLTNDGTFDGWEVQYDTDDWLQAVWWSPSWVPVDADGAGNGTCIDLKPGKNGIMGQVIDFDHDVGPSGPMFVDYPAYLEDIASQLEAGKYINNRGWLEEDYQDY